jgi:hypothetical protein
MIAETSTDAPELMLCIVCMTMKRVRKKGKGEHVFPLSLGGSLIIDRVCIDCDNRLGTKVDAGLINLAAIHQRRVDLELKGQSGELPEKGKHLIGKTIRDVGDPRHSVRWKRDKTGKAVPHTNPHVEFLVEKYDDGMLIQPGAVYIDPADMAKAPALARSALKRAGLNNEVEVERIATEFAASLESTIEQKNFVMTMQVNPNAHRDALLKIAYELAWYWLGDPWLCDPVAILMREALNGNPKPGIRGKIIDDADAVMETRGGDPRVLHIAWVFEFGGALTLWVRVFDVLAAAFVVSDSPKNYHVGERNAIVMQTVEGRYEETKFDSMEPGSVAWLHDPKRSGFNYHV